MHQTNFLSSVEEKNYDVTEVQKKKKKLFNYFQKMCSWNGNKYK